MSDKTSDKTGPKAANENTPEGDVLPLGHIPNPLLASARVVREVYVETVRMIDAGQQYFRGGVDVSNEMREACVGEIEYIDKRVATFPLTVPKLEIIEQARVLFEEHKLAQEAKS